MTEKNMQQILELQKQCYSERVGKIYGDFEVVDVWYDWEERKQKWKMVCRKCGKERITANGKDYVKGKTPGKCKHGKRLKCDIEKEMVLQRRIKKQQEEQERIGKTFGTWTVVKKIGSSWDVRCVNCGNTTLHSWREIIKEPQVKCMCAFNFGKYDGPEWIGRRYGNLVISEYVNKQPTGFVCQCDCGRITKVSPSFLFKGKIKTCGSNECLFHKRKISTHGCSNMRLYRIWRGMLERCYNKNSTNYSTYGGRGIDICDKWRDGFLPFYEWAMQNGYSDELSIDRIDNDSGYRPDNCRWATAKEQNNNKHPNYTFTPKPEGKRRNKSKHTWTIDGETRTGVEWCELYGTTMQATLYRIKTMGMTPEEALKTGKFTTGRPRNAARD